MKNTVLLILLTITTSVFAEPIEYNKNLMKNFELYKKGKMEKSEFIDYINNKLHHPLVDFYQDSKGVYQWIVSNDKFLVSRGISSIEDIKIIKQLDYKKKSNKGSWLNAIVAYGSVDIQGDVSELQMSVLKAGVSYSDLIGKTDYRYSVTAFVNQYSDIKLKDYSGSNSLSSFVPEISAAVTEDYNNFTYGIKYSSLQYFVLAEYTTSGAQLDLSTLHRISGIGRYSFNDKIAANIGIGYITGSNASGISTSIGASYNLLKKYHLGLGYYNSTLDVSGSDEKSTAFLASLAYTF